MRTLLSIITSTLVLAGCASAPQLVQPSGEESIGYQRKVVSGQDRWVDLQVFYPASEQQGEQLVATPDDLADVLSDSFSMPAFLMRDDRKLPVFIDAPVASGQFPVLVFNHGHSSFARQNLENLIELASHGYVVITLSHPGHSLLSKNGEQTVLKDTDIGEYSQDEINALLAQQAADFNALRATQNIEDWQSTMEGVEERSFSGLAGQFDQWIANNETVLAALQNQTAFDATLHDAMDMTAVGYFGHSFGGAVATHMNMQHDAIHASFNLDGPVFAKSLDARQSGEFCFAYGNVGQGKDSAANLAWTNQQVAKAVNGCEWLFNDAAHMNFSDLNQIPMLKHFGILGPVDSELMRQNLNVSLVAFFDQHLRQQGEISKLEGTELIQY